MELLLTSSGIYDQSIFSFIKKRLAMLINPRIAVLHTIRKPTDKVWLAEHEKELSPLGLAYDFINISENQDLSDKNFYDVYYVVGGNTFYILDRLKKTGLFDIIKKSINQGKLYIGLSAGSIIAGPDIKIAGYGCNADKNDIGLKDFSALGVVEFNIYPHYQIDDEKFVKEFYKDQNKPVITLADKQALIVSNGKLQLVGNGQSFKIGF